MKEIDLEYNSSRENLIIPEYGRHVQNLINHAKTLKDPEERQKFAERITRLMMQMNPQSRALEDYDEKLWKHFFRIARYEIEVNPSTGERPTQRDARKIPDRIGYSKSTAKFRHYGQNVQELIEKALTMEEGPKRDGFVAVIGSYMKLAFMTWNKDLFVSDEVIKADLESLSGGKLRIPAEVPIDGLSSYLSKKGGPGNKRSSSGGRSGSRQSSRSSGRSNRNGSSYKSKGSNRNGGRRRK